MNSSGSKVQKLPNLPTMPTWNMVAFAASVPETLALTVTFAVCETGSPSGVGFPSTRDQNDTLFEHRSLGAPGIRTES